MNQNLLTAKDKGLIAVSASVAAGCQPCTEYHVGHARRPEPAKGASRWRLRLHSPFAEARRGIWTSGRRVARARGQRRTRSLPPEAVNRGAGSRRRGQLRSRPEGTPGHRGSGRRDDGRRFALPSPAPDTGSSEGESAGIEIASPACSIEHQTIRDEMSGCVQGLLQGLPEDYRIVLALSGRVRVS
jgi:AhpD family alkylhydroperoxidase